MVIQMKNDNFWRDLNDENRIKKKRKLNKKTKIHGNLSKSLRYDYHFLG